MDWTDSSWLPPTYYSLAPPYHIRFALLCRPLPFPGLSQRSPTSVPRQTSLLENSAHLSPSLFVCVWSQSLSLSLLSLSLFLSTGTSLRSIDVTFSRYDLEMCVYRDARLSWEVKYGNRSMLELENFDREMVRSLLFLMTIKIVK